ncbi:hypothetical protein [Variovorax sp. dw_308]|nr:hypothetical protein [Variovorax sp. dw_308]
MMRRPGVVGVFACVHADGVPEIEMKYLNRRRVTGADAVATRYGLDAQ